MSPEALAAATAVAKTHFTTQCVVEWAGLFWLGAEMGILFMVLEGRRHLDTMPLKARWRWRDIRRSRLAAWGGSWLGLVLLTFLRHALFPPTWWLLGGENLSLTDFEGSLIEETIRHLALWAAFVTGWVVLEILIVFYGWIGYHQLRALLFKHGYIPQRKAAGCLSGPSGFVVFFPVLLTGNAVFAAMAAPVSDLSPLSNAMDTVFIKLIPYQNALYLYLRLAGIVWIVVEWAAALVLLQSVAMLWRAVAVFRKRGGAL